MGYIVDIITESISDNLILVDGLTLEKLKIKYQWIFNAIIEKAIIGEDDYGVNGVYTSFNKDTATDTLIVRVYETIPGSFNFTVGCPGGGNPNI